MSTLPLLPIPEYQSTKSYFLVLLETRKHSQLSAAINALIRRDRARLCGIFVADANEENQDHDSSGSRVRD